MASTGPVQSTASSVPVTISSAAPVGQQQQTTTRPPAHSLQHCHPATGRSPRSELLLLPQQTTAPMTSLAPPAGRQTENLRRHSEAPPTSLPLLHPHGQHSHAQHLHTRQQLHSLASDHTHSKPQRIVESLRRATMVSANYKYINFSSLHNRSSIHSKSSLWQIQFTQLLRGSFPKSIHFAKQMT